MTLNPANTRMSPCTTCKLGYWDLLHENVYRNAKCKPFSFNDWSLKIKLNWLLSYWFDNNDYGVLGEIYTIKINTTETVFILTLIS